MPPTLLPEIIQVIIAFNDDPTTLKSWAAVDNRSRAVVIDLLWEHIAVGYHNIASDQTLWIKQWEEEHGAWLNHSITEASRSYPRLYPPRVITNPKQISLRATLSVSNGQIRHAVPSQDILRIFENPPGHFRRLVKVQIDGTVVNQLVWHTLLKLPALQVLRLWRVGKHPRVITNFDGLIRLRTLEIGGLSPQEAAHLGVAVRESQLASLHISSSSTDHPAEGENAIGNFFTSLTSEQDGGNSSGFPLSLEELALEDDTQR